MNEQEARVQINLWKERCKTDVAVREYADFVSAWSRASFGERQGGI